MVAGTLKGKVCGGTQAYSGVPEWTLPDLDGSGDDAFGGGVRDDAGAGCGAAKNDKCLYTGRFLEHTRLLTLRECPHAGPYGRLEAPILLFHDALPAGLESFL